LRLFHIEFTMSKQQTNCIQHFIGPLGTEPM
jgi:hypothetical protein